MPDPARSTTKSAVKDKFNQTKLFLEDVVSLESGQFLKYPPPCRPPLPCPLRGLGTTDVGHRCPGLRYFSARFSLVQPITHHPVPVARILSWQRGPGT